MALRLGKVNKESEWTIAANMTKPLLRTRAWITALSRLGDEAALDPANPPQITLTHDEARDLIRLREMWTGLHGGSVALGLKQKGVDMRIGLDISTLTLKRHVDTIILIAGDSDFVPAAKLARREGVEFILDPLWQSVNDDLHEHIDGLQSGLPKPGSPAGRRRRCPSPPPRRPIRRCHRTKRIGRLST